MVDVTMVPTMGVSFQNMSRDEVATIWFALGEYKESVLKTAEKSRRKHNPNAIEDEMFCFEVAQRCAALQFAILYDHDTNTRYTIQTYLDIV